MLSGDTKWGGRDVGGLIGSITDGGGYAFLGNGLWTLASLSPIPRYAPAYSKAIAKWVYSVASATKYYYADTPGLAGQSYPHDHWDKHALVVSPATVCPSHLTTLSSDADRCCQQGYEGLRKCDYNRTSRSCLHGESFGPFATGDWCEALNCTDITWDCKQDLPCNARSDRVLYGGSTVGVLGAVVARTNASSVLRIDVLATDVYADHAPPTYLYWNPTKETLWVAVEGEDLRSAASGALLQAGVDCRRRTWRCSSRCTELNHHCYLAAQQLTVLHGISTGTKLRLYLPCT
eukprot:COSAG04_NODE_679_length_11197_cov_43.956584_4_plen_291_part_00